VEPITRTPTTKVRAALIRKMRISGIRLMMGRMVFLLGMENMMIVVEIVDMITVDVINIIPNIMKVKLGEFSQRAKLSRKNIIVFYSDS
jgi:hypothetical protein